MKKAALTFSLFALVLIAMSTSQVAAQTGIRFMPDRTGEIVRLSYGKKSARINIEDEATLPGNPKHRYQVLFSAAKDGRIYLLARVCSRSPMTNPSGPCGGDQPCALLWISADKSLAHRELKSEIFASCSYNFSQVGKTRRVGGKLIIVYEDTAHQKKIELSYDSAHPDQGILKKDI